MLILMLTSFLWPVKVLSDGDMPSVSLLVTLEEEGGPVTHRLASLLGLKVEFKNHDDEGEDVIETEPENVAQGAEESLGNGAIPAGGCHALGGQM